MPSLRVIQAPVFHGYSFSRVGGVRRDPGVEASGDRTWRRGSIEVRGAISTRPTMWARRARAASAVGAITPDRNRAGGVLVLVGGRQSAAGGGERGGGGAGAGMIRRTALGCALAIAARAAFGRLRLSLGGQARSDPEDHQDDRDPGVRQRHACNTGWRACCRPMSRVSSSRAPNTRSSTDPSQADAVLSGAVIQFRHLGRHDDRPGDRPRHRCRRSWYLQVTLTDRDTGKVLFQRQRLRVPRALRDLDRTRNRISTRAAPLWSASARDAAQRGHRDPGDILTTPRNFSRASKKRDVSAGCAAARTGSLRAPPDQRGA